MKFRTLIQNVIVGAFVTIALLAINANVAEAGWRWHGSSGGSHGSWGSSGGSHGSWGSHGSSGGSWGSHGSSGGSWGSHGSSGGSWGSHGSSGGSRRRYRSHYSSHGSWGSHGSSGGSWGSHGSSGGKHYSPSKPAEPKAAPANGKQTYFGGNDGVIAVIVPENAKIFVNGNATTSTGSFRRYVSKNLVAGQNYTYNVRAEIQRDGKTIEVSKTVDLQAGYTIDLTFDFDQSQQAETTLTLNVPADAKVFLADEHTVSTGPVRVFSTSALSAGKVWDSYQVRVTLEKDGQTVTRLQTISLKSGDQRELTFDFAQTELASVR